MNVVNLIVKKREGQKLAKHEIDFLIENYGAGKIPDYQMAAFCMAVYFQGLSATEVADLTMAMVASGEKIDLKEIPGIKVDKHSTGGVADTTTLILGPLVAAAGVPVAKMSGRSLGHTGGTLDKLESVPGLQTNLTQKELSKQVQEIKLALIGQSRQLVPADQKLYALRDVTGTVSSLPLIASSIMSKKIAAGADKIVLDVKLGQGAFMKKKEAAFALAQTMVTLGEKVQRETVALITNMAQPLGTVIGNALEMEEALLVLEGKKQGPLRELSLYLGAIMLILAEKVTNLEEGRELLEHLLHSGKALDKFAAMLAAQGGNPEVIHDFSLLPQARHKDHLKIPQAGFVAEINAEYLGLAAVALGAGRTQIDAPLDLSVGLKILVNLGAKVEKGQDWCTIYYNDPEKLKSALPLLSKALRISESRPFLPPLIYGYLTKEGVQDLKLSF